MLNKNLSIIFFLAAGIFAASAQKMKREKLAFPKLTYAKIPVPSGINTYSCGMAQAEGAVLPFTEAELQEQFQLQELKRANEEDSDLFFAFSGVREADLNVQITRDKGKEMYYTVITPKSDVYIKALLMVNGKATQFVFLEVTPTKDTDGSVIPTKINFDFKEAEKYLIFSNNDQAKASPYLVEEYLRKLYDGKLLEKRLLPLLYETYDNRMDMVNSEFYYLKDKKQPELEKETKAKLKEMEQALSGFSGLSSLRNNNEILDPFKTYWEGILGRFEPTNKANKKLAWPILINLYQIALAQEDFDSAKKYLGKAEETEQKKWYTSNLISDLDKIRGLYALNFNEDGVRKNGLPYEVDPLIERMAAQEKLKDHNFKDKSGYIVTKDGEKLEGVLKMIFYTDPSKAENGIVSLDGDTNGKRVVLTYKNQKGKTKYKTYKCKDVSQIVIGERVFEPVPFKKSVLESESLSLGALGMGNLLFMEKIETKEDLTLYQDLTAGDSYFFKLKKEKKAARSYSKLFEFCPNLLARIKNDEFPQTKEGQLQILENYTKECK